MFKKNSGIAALAVALLIVSAATAKADALADVQKGIHDKIVKLTSFSYKMKMVSETNDPNFSNKTQADATIAYVKKDAKILYRVEMTTKMVMKMQDNETKTDSKSLSIFDGDFVYSYSESNGVKQATKSKFDPSTNTDPFDQLKLFKEQEKQFAFKVLPDETVDGKPCWVLEMTPKDEQMRAYVGKMVACYDKETGITLKTTNYDAKGKATGTTTMSDIKTNISIPPEQFRFTPPPGVEVTDTTKTDAANGS